MESSWPECVVEAVTENFATELRLRVAERRMATLRIESSRDKFAALELRAGDSIEMIVREDGRLDVRSQLGAQTCSVPPDVDYEAWTLTFDDGEMFVCVPGGGITHWPSR